MTSLNAWRTGFIVYDPERPMVSSWIDFSVTSYSSGLETSTRYVTGTFVSIEARIGATSEVCAIVMAGRAAADPFDDAHPAGIRATTTRTAVRDRRRKRSAERVFMIPPRVVAGHS